MTDWTALMRELPLLADGPVGDWLRARGFLQALGAGLPPEAMNLERPDAVAGGHRAYRQAGAVLLRTNTRGANRPDLTAHGLADRCEAANNSASAALRQAIGTGAVLAGSIGPVHAAVPAAERDAAYGEQAVYLSDTGADILILEHFSAVEELRRALRAVLDAADAPPMALLTFDPAGRTAEGLAPAEAGRRLLEAGAESLGVSCTPGGAALDAILADLRPLGAPLGVLLGLEAARTAAPEAEEGEAFAGSIAALAAQGVSIVGGCCGVLPAHLRAAAQRLGRDPREVENGRN